MLYFKRVGGTYASAAVAAADAAAKTVLPLGHCCMFCRTESVYSSTWIVWKDVEYVKCNASSHRVADNKKRS